MREFETVENVSENEKPLSSDPRRNRNIVIESIAIPLCPLIYFWWRGSLFVLFMIYV